MRIFVTGATGRIGSVVARRLAERGYEVIGLTRSREKAKGLEAQGIVPVVGNLGNVELLTVQAQAADAVIHAGYTWGNDTAEIERSATNTFINAFRGTAKSLLTTSGMAVLGTTGDEAVDESKPVASSSPLAWRAELEQLVLCAPGLRGIVIRSSLAYDNNGHRITDALIQRARQRQAGPYIGCGSSRWSTVHLEDLADLYVLALERASAGTLFHASGGDFGMLELAECIARRLKLHRIESWSIEEAQRSLSAAPQLAQNMLISAARARIQLDWTPSRPQLCNLIEYARSWREPEIGPLSSA